MLAELLNDRLLSVSEAGSEAAGDMKSTTYVCSAAFEASVGGEDAAVERGRGCACWSDDDYRGRCERIRGD